eukprot:Amastigsp_a681899_6.p5 type:complete len:102 gc:universal Amastigsp_a681899_6:167-472(+)
MSNRHRPAGSRISGRGPASVAVLLVSNENARSAHAECSQTYTRRPSGASASPIGDMNRDSRPSASTYCRRCLSPPRKSMWGLPQAPCGIARVGSSPPGGGV